MRTGELYAALRILAEHPEYTSEQLAFATGASPKWASRAMSELRRLGILVWDDTALCWRISTNPPTDGGGV